MRGTEPVHKVSCMPAMTACIAAQQHGNAWTQHVNMPMYLHSHRRLMSRLGGHATVVDVAHAAAQRRRAVNQAAAAAAVVAMQPARRQRVFTLRVSFRTLLQALVFAVVMYQVMSVFDQQLLLHSKSPPARSRQ